MKPGRRRASFTDRRVVPIPFIQGLMGSRANGMVSPHKSSHLRKRAEVSKPASSAPELSNMPPADITLPYHERGKVSCFSPTCPQFRLLLQEIIQGRGERRTKFASSPSSGKASVIVPVAQISVVAAVGAYLVRCRIEIQRRNRQTWPELVARLSSGWSVAAFREDFAAEPLRIIAIYRDAQVMQEIADFASRRLPGVDRALVESLHRDATQARYRAIAALLRYARKKPPKPTP